jgi:hypothetical protein
MIRFMSSATKGRGQLAFAFACAFTVVGAAVGTAQDSQSEPAPASKATEPKAPPCRTQLRLGATFYLDDQPDRSLAMLRKPGSTRAGLYRRGMYFEGFAVVSVEPRRVLLRRDAALCWLRLTPDPRPEPPRPRGH